MISIDRIYHLARLMENKWWRVDDEENPLKRLTKGALDHYRSAILFSRYGSLVEKSQLDTPFDRSPLERVQFDFGTDSAI